MKKRAKLEESPRDFKTFYNATIIKTMQYRHKDRHRDQWNRIMNPEINPYTYDEMTLDKNVKTIQQGNNTLSTNGVATTEYPH